MDRRKFVREFTASGVKLFDMEGNLICDVNVNDISEGGILVVSYGFEDFEDFDPHDKLKFSMKIPTGEVSGVAEVVWTNPDESRMGLKFVEILNKEGVSNLMAFVANEFF